MKMRFSYKHMESSEALAERAEEKVDRVIEKYLHNPTDCQVTFSVEHNLHRVDCHILASGGISIHSSAESDHMYTAIDLLADKLESLLKKQKDKLSNKNHASIKTKAYEGILDQDYIEAEDVSRVEQIRQENHERLK